MHGSKRWLYAQHADEIESDPLGHGTAMLSKAVGLNHGVAKQADVVIVKMILGALATSLSMSVSSIISALVLILDDIEQQGLQGKAVINCSWGKQMLLSWCSRAETDIGFPELEDVQLGNVVKSMFNYLTRRAQAVVVLAAGNDGVSANLSIDRLNIKRSINLTSVN